MSAKQCAVRDIFTDLAKSGKCFIAFHRELDKAIDKLVNNQIKQQELCQSSKEAK